MPELLITDPMRWSCQHPTPRGCVGRHAVNFNTSNGYLDSDRGYAIDRKIAAAATAPGGSFTHVDEAGGEWEWMYYNAALYKNDGASPSTIGSAVTASWKFATYNMPNPCGFSGFFNGTNSEALIVRRTSAGTDIEAELHDFAQPTLIAPTVTPVDSGTWSTTGNILVRVAMLDKDGNVLVSTAPSAAQTVTINATTDSITVARPTDARASHWRVAFTAIGGTDTPSAYIYWEDLAYATTSKKYTTLLADAGSQAFTDENGTYRQAVMPITGVDSCWLHEGRLFIASSVNDVVAWSERGNTNHWYSDQVLNTAADQSLGGPVIGGCSISGVNYVFTPTSTHVVYGDLTRDRVGQDATWAIRVKPEQVHATIGLASHGSLVPYGGGVFFWSNLGPAVLAGGRVDLLLPEDIDGFLRTEFDATYATRIYGALDPDLHAICWNVPRRTNATRALDGASTAGWADVMIRWDLRHGYYMPPRRECDLAHIACRKRPASQGAASTRLWLTGVSPYAAMVRFNLGASGGGATDAASDTDYDGKATTAVTTTSATFTVSGVIADEFNDKTVTLTYPSDDTAYPGFVAQKTILDTTVAGSAVTIVWTGALTVPSASGAWTVRVGGRVQSPDLPINWRAYVDLPPGAKVDTMHTEILLRDVAGQEAIS